MTRSGVPERAAVVGAGTMGVGFAQVLALGGVDVALCDATPERGAAARERAIALARRFADAELLGADAPDRIAERTVAHGSVEAAAEGAAIVLEAVPEDVPVKGETLALIERGAPADAIVATNTSAIPIGDLAAPLRRPERFLGAHWFNPPQWVPCVEVIPGPATAGEVVTALERALRELGKEPVVVGDSAGFVANRIQFAMFREAAAVVAEGVASPEAVDAVVRSSFGFRLPFYGPFAIADMAGLDVYLGAYDSLERAHGLAAPDALRALVAQGRLGTKSGGGFVSGESDGDAAALRRDRAYAALRRLVADLGAWD